MPYQTLISVDDLLPFLDHPLWAIVDCRFDLLDPTVGEHDYHQGHIPGAVYLHLERDLSAPPSGTNGRHPLPTDEKLISVFSQVGIGPDVQVVGYDDRGGGFAARLWWSLRYLGHDAVAVLNGGYPAWLRDEHPVRSGVETRAVQSFVAELREEMKIELNEVGGMIGSNKVVFLDARAPERYRGEVEPYDRVAGHIPGAINHFWETNLDQGGYFLPNETLKARFQSILKEVPAQAVIGYCGSGVTSCHNVLAMEHSGLSGARLYPGSWSEWCTDPTRPTAQED